MKAIPDLSRGIMLEGISCAGKTSTMYAIKHLFATDRSLERNIIMLGEHYTQVLNSVNGQLINHQHEEHTQMLFERIEMIELLNKWACSLGDFNKRSRGLYTVLERGYLNHVAFYEDYDNPEICELGDRYSKMGIEAILLIISDELLESRIRLRDKQINLMNSDEFYKAKAEQAKIYQDKMLWVREKANIPSRVIYTDTMKWDNYALEIVRKGKL